MRYLILILLLIAVPAYATDTALIDRDGVTTPVTLGAGAYAAAGATSVTTANGVSGTVSGGALTINIGAITPTSVVASGLIDGTAPIVLSTTSSYTLGSTYKTNYTFNNHNTASQAITYTLPSAEAGRTECVGNWWGKTGTLRVNTYGGQYIIKKGVRSAAGGYVISGGALGDGACFVATDTVNWIMYVNDGTWTLN